MRCDDIREQAGCIAVLAEDDPARQAALEHAKNCDECRAALARADEAMKLLDLDGSDEPPEGALERVATVVRGSRAAIWLGVGAAASAIALDVAERLLGDHTVSDFGRLWPAGLALLACAIAVATLAPRERHWLLGTAVLCAGLFPLVTLQSAGADHDGPLCFGIEVASAAAPLGVAVALVWMRRLRPSALSFATIAAAGALAAQAAALMTCPYRVPYHLFVYHTGGVIVAALIGCWAALLFDRRAYAHFLL